MKRRAGALDSGRVPAWAWIVPFLLIGAAAFIGDRVGHPVPGQSGAVRGRAPAPTVLEMMSRRPGLAFGFRNLFADIAWLEAVQVAGVPRLSRNDYDRLAGLIETVTRFDPGFVVPYLMGAIVLGDSPAHAPSALRILRQGQERFPTEWRLPFYDGYIRYFSLGDPAGGGEALLRASRIQGSPAYFPLLASRMLSEGNRPETALAYLRGMVNEEKDPLRRRSLEERIRRVLVERDLQILEDAVDRFRKRNGTSPGVLDDLVRSGLIARIPDEPYGGRYLLTPDGGVRSDRAPAERLKVLRKQ